jgi:hypothetical protein
MPTYRLPDGKTTTDTREYSQAWGDVAYPLERAFGWRVFAYNPGFVFERPGKKSTLVTLDTDAVRQIADVVVRLEEFENAGRRR